MKRKDQGSKDLPPAPGELRLFQAFVNTADFDAGSDELATPRALADWLARHGLLPPATELSETERQRAIEVREGWRSLVAGSLSKELAGALDRATEAALLRARHAAGGSLRIEPAAAGLDGALGRLLAIVARAQADASWRRLKACASPACRAIFWDRSANHSKRWCRPLCGNRMSSRNSKRRTRRADRRAREASRRARVLAQLHKPPSLSEIEDHPQLGDVVRMLREREQGR